MGFGGGVFLVVGFGGGVFLVVGFGGGAFLVVGLVVVFLVVFFFLVVVFVGSGGVMLASLGFFLRFFGGEGLSEDSFLALTGLSGHFLERDVLWSVAPHLHPLLALLDRFLFPAFINGIRLVCM